MGSSRWPLKVRLHLSISTALMRPRRPKQYCLQLDIALWCKNQIEHSIWDESLLFSNCARSLEYSSSSTLAGLSYHICGKLEVAFKGSPSSQHQHCTDEVQKAETVVICGISQGEALLVYSQKWFRSSPPWRFCPNGQR